MDDEYTFTASDKIQIVATIAMLGYWAYRVNKTRVETKKHQEKLDALEKINRKLQDPLSQNYLKIV